MLPCACDKPHNLSHLGTWQAWHLQSSNVRHATTHHYPSLVPAWQPLTPQRAKGLLGVLINSRHISSRHLVITAAAPTASHQQLDSIELAGPIVVIDNYDSFTYNLCQYLGDLGCEPIVFSNDEKSVQEIRDLNPAGVLVSPGPGAPEDSGISLQIVHELGPDVPVFGVCMGHQCIGQVYGGKIVRAPSGVMHGKSSLVFHTGVGLLQGLENPFPAARYHSLVIEKDSCPPELEVTAWTEDGTIMAVRHRQYPHVQGVQFHPESIITNNGIAIVRNFLSGLA